MTGKRQWLRYIGGKRIEVLQELGITLKSLYALGGMIIALAVVVVMAMPAPAFAQEVEVESIEAIVNDEVISEYDVEQRLNLILAAAGSDISPEQRELLRQQSLQNLVDEKLQLQEAAEFDLVISDEEVSQTIGRIGRQYDMSPEQFVAYLERSGASVESLAQQVRAELAWTRLVRGRLNSQVAVSDDEVQNILDRLEQNAGQNEYLVSEIFLIADTPEKDRAVRQTADRLVEQLRQGAPFNVMARQFSESATAAVGGDMGWVQEGQLIEEVSAALENMRPRTISSPVRAPGGYYILLLRDRRKVATADPLDIQLDLTQMTFPVPNEEGAKEARMSEIRLGTSMIMGCEDIAATAEEIGASGVNKVGTMRIGDLPAPIQTLVEPLGPGEVTPPFEAGDNIQVLVVCGRNEPEVNMPTFDAIEESLRQQRLSMMARRYLRDLRRDAIVDYR